MAVTVGPSRSRSYSPIDTHTSQTDIHTNNRLDIHDTLPSTQDSPPDTSTQRTETQTIQNVLTNTHRHTVHRQNRVRQPTNGPSRSSPAPLPKKKLTEQDSLRLSMELDLKRFLMEKKVREQQLVALSLYIQRQRSLAERDRITVEPPPDFEHFNIDERKVVRLFVPIIFSHIDLKCSFKL